MGLKQLGHELELFVGFSTSVNRHQVNSQPSGSWNNIPFHYLSGTSKYAASKVIQLVIYVRFIINAWRQVFKARNNKTLHFIYDPTPRDYMFLLPALRWFRVPTSILLTEMPTLVTGGFLRRLNERWIIQSKATLLVVSENLKAHYRNQGVNPKLITPIVADVKRFNSISYQSSKCIGYLGTFGEKDGIPMLIAAFLRAKDQLPEVSLTLMGHIPDKNTRAWIEKVVQQHPSIHWTGMVDYSQLPWELQKCDTLVMNRTDTQYARTGFPIKLAEYLSTGIPTLVTNFDEYHQYIPESWVYYYQPDNVSDFCTTLISRYKNEDEALKRAKLAKENVTQVFGQEKAATELNAIFEELMKTHDAR